MFFSLWDRFSDMWPKALQLMDRPEYFLVGKGIGAIGSPQQYGPDFLKQNAADSIFIYIFVTFGFLGIVYLFALISWFTKSVEPRQEIQIWTRIFLIFAFGYGISTNMIEEPFFSGLFGLILGMAFYPSRRNENG
jgi:hypothetical protein